jgi:hypothetical protein
MIRVYFRMGNRLKSRVYDGKLNVYISHAAKALTIERRSEFRGEREVGWFWNRRFEKFIEPFWHEIAQYAPGEWVRWEWEPEPKEEKSAKDPVRT